MRRVGGNVCARGNQSRRRECKLIVPAAHRCRARVRDNIKILLLCASRGCACGRPVGGREGGGRDVYRCDDLVEAKRVRFSSFLTIYLFFFFSNLRDDDRVLGSSVLILRSRARYRCRFRRRLLRGDRRHSRCNVSFRMTTGCPVPLYKTPCHDDPTHERA